MKVVNSTIRQRKILKFLVDFCNGQDLKIFKGWLSDVEGRPLLYIPKDLIESITQHQIPDMREYAVLLLSQLANNPDASVVIAGVINQKQMPLQVFLPDHGQAFITPSPRTPNEMILAIMAIALATQDGPIPLAERVSRCGECNGFFLKKTKRGSMYCSRNCRTVSSNRNARIRSQSSTATSHQRSRVP